MTEPASSNPLARLKIQRGGLAPKRRKSWVRWAVIGAVVVVVAAAFLAMPRKPEVQVVSVITTTPSQQFAQLTASGYVVAQRRAAVSSKASGRLEYLAVAEGSRVKAGDLIARLDARDVAAQLAGANAAVNVSQAALASAEVEFRNAQADYARVQSLVKQNFVSASAADDARARVERAQAAVAQARAGVENSRAGENAAAVAKDFTEIRAPFDGVVLVKNANVGDNITPFSSAAGSLGAVVTMADMSTLEVEADVSESSLAKVSIGMPVEIVLDALPDTRFKGSVARIVPTVDRAKATVMTKIKFDKLDARILPEMSAKVTFLSKPITEADQKPVLAVNPAAIVEREGKPVLLRVNKTGADAKGGEVVELVPVQRGAALGESVIITGEVKSGDRVVLKPDAKLATGSAVRVAGR
jgi:HlyD family secretion protein